MASLRPKMQRLVCTMLLALVTPACSAAIAGDPYDESMDPGDSEPEDPSPEDPEPEDPQPEPEPEPEPEPGFDINDPADYRWTLTLESYYTLEVLFGSAQVQWSRFAPGVDLAAGVAAESGILAGPTLLASNISWTELTGSGFQFRTIREQDGLPMTSCVKLVDAASAIESHNEILTSGAPVIDNSAFTNPNAFATHLAQLDGVLLLVNGDCTTPAAENPTEQRSVLSWTAVTIEASPDPQVYNPASDPDPSAGIHPAGA